MQYCLKDTVLRTNEKYGVIQNAGQYDIEVSDSENFTEIFILESGKTVSFNRRLFLRRPQESPHTVKVNVVQFISLGGFSTNSSGDTEDTGEFEDTDDYFDDIFSGDFSANVDDPDFNSYIDGIFSGDYSATTDNADFNSYLDNIYP